MAISATLDHLRLIQIVDDGIRALEAELEQFPKRLARAQENLSRVKALEAEAETGLAEIQKKRRDVEQEVETADETVIKFENDKLNVKTNTEFRALNIQIDGQKQKRSALEDLVLLSYDEEEQAKELLARARGETKAVEKSLAEEEEDIRRRTEEDKGHLEERRLDRKGLEESIGGKLLGRYEAIRGRGGGTAVVSVSRGACGGCHTHQPAQKVNEIRKRDALHYCDFCGRFLLWNVEEAAAS